MRNCDDAYGMFVAATEVASHEGTIDVNVGATMLQPSLTGKRPDKHSAYFWPHIHPRSKRACAHARRLELQTIRSIQLRQQSDSGFQAGRHGETQRSVLRAAVLPVCGGECCCHFDCYRRAIDRGSPDACHSLVRMRLGSTSRRSKRVKRGGSRASSAGGHWRG